MKQQKRRSPLWKRNSVKRANNWSMRVILICLGLLNTTRRCLPERSIICVKILLRSTLCKTSSSPSVKIFWSTSIQSLAMEKISHHSSIPTFSTSKLISSLALSTLWLMLSLLLHQTETTMRWLTRSKSRKKKSSKKRLLYSLPMSKSQSKLEADPRWW